ETMRSMRTPAALTSVCTSSSGNDDGTSEKRLVCMEIKPRADENDRDFRDSSCAGFASVDALTSPLSPVIRGEGPGGEGFSIPRGYQRFARGTLTPSPPTPLPRSGGEGRKAQLFSDERRSPFASAQNQSSLDRIR